ncbi:MAG TPA: hypothetical protein VJ730_06435 [Nitrososphaera sp.]|nr:hypothetical protein [Nitrososphaera sp.]
MNPKFWLAAGLAAATLVLFLAVIAIGGALRAGLAPWPGIGAIVLAAVAFAVSYGHRSFLVAGLLAAGGLVGLVYGLITTDFASVEFRGPIFGVIIGIPILGLGVAKGVEAARTGKITA